MCTVTLSYNENNKIAAEKLLILLGTGLFEKIDLDDLDIADNESVLSDEDLVSVLLSGFSGILAGVS